MGNIRIVADSTCDLSPELKEKYGIVTIPLCIILDDQTYLDGEDISPDQIYEWSNTNKSTPKTAAIPYDKALSILEPYMEQGDDIIYLGISEQMSTTCNVIRLIGNDREYDKIHVIDSMNLSTGIGLQLLYAAQLVKEGLSVPEIIERIENKRSKVRASFVVETLTYLARGGRCKPVTALLGNTLKLKPQIVVERGVMGVSRKYRGKQSAVIMKYAQDLESSLLHADPSFVFITHSGCDQALLNEIYTYLKNLNHFDNIYITRAGGVISSHCGPGTLGILYYAD